MYEHKQQLETVHKENFNVYLNKDINFQEVLYAVRNVKSNKSSGIDNIPNEVLKQPSIVTLMHILLNYCFKNSVVPSAWLKGIIVPVPKGCMKDSNVPLNYRGITLLSCMSIIYTSIINKRISGFAETAGIFVEEQSGFRGNRSCLDNLFSLTSIIRNVRNEGKSLFTAFIDMQKAFDWLDRDLLLYKLLNYGINGRIYNAVKQLYCQTTY